MHHEGLIEMYSLRAITFKSASKCVPILVTKVFQYPCKINCQLMEMK